VAFFGFLSNLLEYGFSVLLPDVNRRRQTSLCVTSVAGNFCIYHYIPLLGPSWPADQFRFGKKRRLMQKLTEIWELKKQSLLKLDYMMVINPKKHMLCSNWFFYFVGQDVVETMMYIHFPWHVSFGVWRRILPTQNWTSTWCHILQHGQLKTI
jgi:hypothetical protein